MAKKSLKENLVRYLATHNEWRTKAQILNYEWKYLDGTNRVYMPDSVSRKLREAEEESRIAVKDDPNSKSVVYKFLPPERRKDYINWSSRPDNAKGILFKS